MIDILRSKIIKRARRLCYRVKSKTYSFSNKLPVEIGVDEKNIIFFNHNSGTEIPNLYKQYFIKNIGRDMKSARRICEHKFEFLGHSFQFADDINWRLDPVSNKEWNKGFCFDIVYGGPNRIGDIKLPWELNKHQYLFTLGKLYWLTGEDSFFKEIIAEIDSWINENPIYKGLNWISSLEIGMRVISWILVYPFIVQRMSQTFYSKFINSLFQQIEFIEENLSYSRFSNNHLIGEAACLIIGGLFLKTPKSRKWITKGINIISKEIQKQVFDDGVNREQSLNYQRFFLDYLYMILILLKKNNIGYPKVIDTKVAKMSEFILYALKPDGFAPPFGDADDARGIYIKEDCIHDYRGVLSLGAVLFNRGDFKYIAGDLTEEILWLLGKEGVEKYFKIEAILPSKISIGFEKGGYYVQRDEWSSNANYLIFDCGPLGYGPAVHGHADALSFQLYSKGFNYFIDPGTYSYNIDYDWRNYFRSTHAHNTIVVDNSNQSEIKKSMSWGTRANAKCNFWFSDEYLEIVDGEHDGYKRLDDPVLHRRIIFFSKKKYWVILDLLRCKREHTFDYHLHLNPNCFIKGNNLGSSFEIACPNQTGIRVAFIGDSGEVDNETEIFRGDERTRLGWFSEYYGSKLATNTIRFRKKSKGNTNFLTLLNASDIDYRVNIRHQDDDSISLSIDSREGGIRENIFYSLSSSSVFHHNSIFFEGKILYLIEKCSEGPFIFGKDVLALQIKDNIEITSKSIIHLIKMMKDA